MIKKASSYKYYLFLHILFFAATSYGQVSGAGKWLGPQTLQTLHAAPVSLIPFPQQVQWTKEKWVLPKHITITIAVEENERTITENALRSLIELLTASSIKYNLKNVKPGEKLSANIIQLKVDNNPSLKAESYLLQISKSGILIKAKDAAGFYYAIQTFRQIIAQSKAQKQLPGCSITDWPAFGLRGFMHDNGRNFQSIEMLKAQLDKLSWYKFNVFHWHITDNPAWRPQSNIYPQLNDPKNRKQGRDPDSTYSFNEIRELIRYARERSITVIPLSLIHI